MANGLEVEKVEGGAKVSLMGDLDLATAPQLREAVGKLIDDRIGSIVIDLAQLAFMDSRGIGELLILKRRADATGVDWKIVNVSDGNMRVVSLLGMVETLNVDT